MSISRSNWSEDEEHQLIQYFRSGYTDEQASSLLPGRTPDAVAARRVILKLEKGAKVTPKTPRAVNETLVASLLNTSEASCRNIINNTYCGGFVPPKRRRSKCYCDSCYAVISGGFPSKHK